MIEADLAKYPQCPRKGFQVTVYHYHLRAKLTDHAGCVTGPQSADLTEDLAERLRKRYD